MVSRPWLSGSRLIVRDALGAGEDVLLPEGPGTFCTPVISRGRLLVAFDRGTRSLVASTTAMGEDLRELVEIDGLLAMLPSPDGRWLALGSAAADQSPYRGLWRLPLDGPARPQRVTDRDCIAFFWLPDSQGLLTIESDEEQGCLWWQLHLPDSGDRRRVGSMRPTREMMFHLHFFEQFAQSHPLVSPCGRFLVQASYADPRRDGVQGLARLERIDLADPHASFEPMAEGSYGVFAPP